MRSRDSGVEVPGQRSIADGIYMGLGRALCLLNIFVKARLDKLILCVIW